ncbi:hypothetical protein [Citrobacter werkmanii]|uniref:hypothetical protein n=1 Tax=Citrobacter werkmanii TaxID=67827 RepID=UPI002652B2FD|nr:hypothetical protein [Citrobacter werkmanii]MDN8554969.1 hypothetical protein [Citrobacter werkmanii]
MARRRPAVSGIARSGSVVHFLDLACNLWMSVITRGQNGRDPQERKRKIVLPKARLHKLDFKGKRRRAALAGMNLKQKTE